MDQPTKKQKFNYIHNLKDIRCELCCSELYSFTDNCDEYNCMYPFGNDGIQFCCKNPNCKTYYYACEKCSNEKEDYIVLCQFYIVGRVMMITKENLENIMKKMKLTFLIFQSVTSFILIWTIPI